MNFVTRKITSLETELSFKHIFQIICENHDDYAAEYFEGGEIRRITYAEYREKSIIMAYRLKKLLGEERSGCFVGLKLDNCPDWPVFFWAILIAGYKPLLLDCRQSEQLTKHLLHESNAKALISNLSQEIGPDFIFIFTGDILAQTDKPPVNWELHWADEIALCTSGTTATSKIFVYNGHAVGKQIINAEQLYRTNHGLLQERGMRSLAFLPFHHIFGFLAVYLWLSFFGATMVYLKDRAPNTIIETCKRHRVTHIFAVPLFWNNMATNIIKKVKQASKETEFNRLCWLSLALQKVLPRYGQQLATRLFFRDIQKNLLGEDIRLLICGGGHLLPETLRIINALGYYLVCGFGMTESGITSVEVGRNINRIINGSLGRPFTTIKYKLVPIKDQQRQNVGELYIQGESLHSGMMIKGVAVPQVRDADGWFSTGDIAKIESGFMRIEGRLKEVIINESGENVYPDELEDYFSKLDHVEQLCVAGIKTQGPYEDISLILYTGELSPGINIKTELAVEINKINSRLPIFKKIKTVLISAETLPLVNGIKVQRQKLKELIESGSRSFNQLDFKGLAAEGPILYQQGAARAEIASTALEQLTNESEVDRIKTEVKSCFADVLGISLDAVKDEAHFIDDLGGDSLQSIELLARIEEKYNLLIPDVEYYSCTNVNEVTAMIYRKVFGEGVIQKPEMPNTALRKRITKFEESREFRSFAARQKLVETMKNPYFVCHDSVVRDVSIVDERQVINFGSYNYLGMSGHPETVKAAQDAAVKYGTSASGSRLIAGEKHLYQELEREIAKWKHTEAAIVLVSGHATNVTLVGNFCNENDLILYDALSHNSIVQGCALSKSPSKAFPHNDFQTLEHILKGNRDHYEKVLLIVEGVYSMDGDIAPIPQFVELKKKYGLFLMVDEAHSSCVIGRTGRGVDEYFDLGPKDIDLKMGTLSKGLGACGGYLAGDKRLIEYLHYNLPGFAFSVGISPPLAAAVLAALKVLQRDSSMVERLHANIACFIKEAHCRSFNTCLAKETSIIPILVGTDEACYIISNSLLEKGIFVPPAVYPAVPKNQSRLRFCVTSEHKPEQIIKALDLLEEAAAENQIKLPS